MDSEEFERMLVKFGTECEPDRISADKIGAWFSKAGSGEYAKAALSGFIHASENPAISFMLADTAPRDITMENCLSYALLLGFTHYSNMLGQRPEDFSDMYVYADYLRGKDPAFPSNERICGECASRASLFNAAMKPEAFADVKARIENSVPELRLDEGSLRKALVFAGGLFESRKAPKIRDMAAGYFAEYFRLSGCMLGETGELLHDNWKKMDETLSARADRIKLWQGICDAPMLASSLSESEMPEFVGESLKRPAKALSAHKKTSRQAEFFER